MEENSDIVHFQMDQPKRQPNGLNSGCLKTLSD